jgi:hypothetical protein
VHAARSVLPAPERTKALCVRCRAPRSPPAFLQRLAYIRPHRLQPGHQFKHNRRQNGNLNDITRSSNQSNPFPPRQTFWQCPKNRLRAPKPGAKSIWTSFSTASYLGWLEERSFDSWTSTTLVYRFNFRSEICCTAPLGHTISAFTGLEEIWFSRPTMTRLSCEDK